MVRPPVRTSRAARIRERLEPRHSGPAGVAWLLVLLLAIACGDSRPPTPSPPGTGAGETITGRERIGWDQPAANTSELATFRYAIYVDGARSELADVSCAQTAAIPSGRTGLTSTKKSRRWSGRIWRTHRTPRSTISSSTTFASG